jgi:8-oxo-dGTP pyrophosphatase MutT (NUDIX family)
VKASFTEVTYFGGQRVEHGRKVLALPFERVTARGLIVRRRDGALLAARHMAQGRFALPGGGVNDGESPDKALLRELAEEDITLIGLADGWQDMLGVYYFDGYKELAMWYLMSVEDATWLPNPEVHEIRWLEQAEGGWYPHQHPLILHLIHRYLPEYAFVDLNMIPRPRSPRPDS